MALCASPASGQALGTIDFPTSGSPAAQPSFIRGVLYMHSFEYPSALAEFQKAEAIEPNFAMAYWGEAMAYTHPVWDQQDRDKARAALTRLAPTPAARLAKAPTAREKEYLDAVETLYGEGTKEKRDTLYSAVMGRISARYPDDQEAKVFYALSLIGLSQGIRNVSTYIKAGAIAEEVYRRNPDHPGAVHYTIHAFDDPVHAPLGLYAARAYSKIAPGAAHAQHMTTHIFLALGLWDDVVSQNEIALGPNADKYTPNHYSEWLAYGYLQQGRLADAARLQETFWRNVNNPMPEGQREGMVIVRATYVMNTGRWDDPSLSRTFTVSDLSPTAQAVEAFLRGYIAVAHKDNARAAAELAKLDALSHMKAADTDQPERDKVAILRNELRAVIRHAGGATEEAIGLLRETARIQDATPAEFGPPDVVKPVYELLGEMLMTKKGMAHEAERAFERSLELAPRRSASLLGLARASNLAGDRLAAAGAYADLASVWRHADAEVPGLAEARQSGGVGAIR